MKLWELIDNLEDPFYKIMALAIIFIGPFVGIAICIEAVTQWV